MPRRGHPTPLDQVLAAMLERRGKTRTEFARRVGISDARLSKWSHRLPTTIPEDLDIGTWARVLELSPQERRQLEIAVHLTWSTAMVQEIVHTMVKRQSKDR